MPKILQLCQSVLYSGFSFIERVSRPYHVDIQDRLEYETAYVRNISFLVFSLLAFIGFSYDLYSGLTSLDVFLFRVSMNIGTITVMFWCMQIYPHMFKIIHFCLVVIYGPIFLYLSENGIHRSWLCALVLPTLSYAVTRSFKSFIVHSIVQGIFTNGIYKTVMLRTVRIVTPEEFTEAFIDSINLGISLNLGMIAVVHYFFINAENRVEKKQDEVETQKTFLLGFSHELRNLINSLTGSVKLAGSEQHLTPRTKGLLRNAEVCGELLLHLINNILDTGKVEIGDLEINPVPTRVSDALEKIWGVCTELIRSKKLTGKMVLPKDLPNALKIDPYRLTQIFLNLIGNAVKFTENGSIDITIDWIRGKGDIDETCFQPYPFNYLDDHDEGLFEKQKVLSGLDKNLLTLDHKTRKIDTHTMRESFLGCNDKGILKVSVSDTGCGMTPEEMGKIFQRFAQVNPDAAKRKLGTGLGLFITKELCERMNGEIRVFSEKGVGSSFILCIPVEMVEQETQQLQNLESLQKNLALRGLKAMIVDDTEFNHAVLKHFFDKIGIEVKDTAMNGLEACEKYSNSAKRGERPQIVAMDLEMPVMDGKQAAKNIRLFERKRGLKPCFLVVISGNCSESEIAECLDKKGNIKADAFLKKPVTMEDILRATGNFFLKE